MVNKVVVHSSKRIALLLIVVMGVVGCAPIFVPVGQPSPRSAPKPAPAPTSPPVRQIEPTPSAPAVANSAVMQLLQEGWRLHNNGEYDQANAVAERALRLDRANSGIYLLLASNYFSMWQLSLAEQIARQGIPLASNDRSTQTELRTLLNQILSAQ